ncbi:vitamin B12 transporter [Robiginitalea myxolifaciens]|uniref:Vitamin B12 transporter n=2 Tax=Robiginitalea myxolifaciens TaxID=400055 RepID=A0A1I6FN19_9FLAO|nr:vitamin B12 transporter [Robiginitalea myxolifaciens]
MTCCWGGGASAQQGSQEPNQDSVRIQRLDEVVVSDTRFPIPREQSGKTVIRLDRADIESYSGLSVAEILNRQPGLEINGSRSRPGEVLGVFARGGRGRQVLILIDGVRVSDPSSISLEYDLRLLAASDIESIEILKGASSTLYGAQAATAVISITTRKAAGKPLAVEISQRVGTLGSSEDSFPVWGQFGSAIRLSGTQQELTYQAGLTYSLDNGLSSLETETNEKDAFGSFALNLGLGWQPTDKTRIQLLANRSQFNAAYDDSFAAADAVFEYWTTQERLTLTGTHQSGADTWELRMGLSNYESENRSSFPGEFKGRTLNGELLYKRSWGADLKSLVGLQVVADQAEFEAAESFLIIDPHLNLVWSPGSFNLNTGVRLNVHSEYGSQAVYQINPSYNIPVPEGNVKVLASWATAYITPSLSQLFGPFGANPDLEPEANRSIEAGTVWNRGSWEFGVLYFNREERQQVLFDNANFQYFNADGTGTAQGVEVTASGNLSPDWKWDAQYTFTDPTTLSQIRVPGHTFSSGLQYAPGDRLQTALNFQHVGSRTDTNFTQGTNQRLDPFSLWDMRISYSWFNGKLRGFFLVSNIFNTEFTEVIGFQTPGRNFLLGGTLRL